MSRVYDRDSLLALCQENLPLLSPTVCDILNELGIHAQSPGLACAQQNTAGWSRRPVEGRFSEDERLTSRHGFHTRDTWDQQKQPQNWRQRRDEDDTDRGTEATGNGWRGRGRGWTRGGTGGRGGWGRGTPPVTADGRQGNGWERTVGVGGQNRTFPSRPFPVDSVSTVNDPDEATLQVLQNIKAFQEFLDSDAVSPADATTVLRALSKATKSEFHEESVLKILQTVCASRFLDSHLPSLINHLSISGVDQGIRPVEVVEMIHQLVSSITRRLPSFASKGSLLLSYISQAHKVMSTLRSWKPGLEDSLKELKEECERCTKMVQSASQLKQQAKVKHRPNQDDETPPESYIFLPILPSWHDMDWTEKPFLRANKSEGGYKDNNHYLDVQVRLLREDYIRPLRNGLKEYRRTRDTGQTSKRNTDLRFYQRVRIVGMSCAFTLQHRLQFDNAHLRNVQWQFSKRLQYGSLVCLSQDDFETIYFATVTERKVKDLSRGIIQVTFERDLTQILNMTSNDEFVMAETTAFFEAYRHVLERLTRMFSVPMMRYIVQCRKDVKPPKYLYTESESKKMNLRSLLKQQAGFRHTEVQVLLPRDWPRLEELALNESQLEAVRTALTKELAIIQGPPGTGKTYVGLKVAQVLLENNDVWSYPHRYYQYSSLPSYRRKPILVVCYTNHALDQFLEGILGFCPEGIIRVGSRSKNESLEPFNLKQIRAQWRKEKKLSDCLRRSIGMTLGALKNSGEKLARSTARYAGSMGNAIIEERALKDSMLAAHYDSLVKVRHYDSGWGLTVVTGQTRSVMADWLLFGNVVLNQDEEFDPYSMLAQKVSTCILSGTDICSESDVDTSADVTSLPFAVRAQLYRTWLKKLGLDTGGNRTKTGDNEDLDASKGAPMDDFLPDDVLKPVVDPRLYDAITSSVLQQLEEEKRFCIRAWLGIHEESREMSMEVLSNTWDFRLEKDFTTDTILTVSRIHRIHLYRYWVTGVAHKLKFDESKGRRKHAHEKLLKRSQREILSDDILEPVVNKDLFSAIKRGMLQKLERQTAFCIRTWLGLHEFSQDPHALERVLEELSAAETDNPDDGEENDDVDADITYIDDVLEPDERVLDDDYDDDDDEDFFPRGLYSNRLDASASLTSPKWPTSVPEDGWTIPKSTRNKRLGQLKHLLQKLTPMDEVEARKVTDVWDAKLTLEDRVRLYLFWMKRYRPRLAHTLQDKAVEFRSCSMIYHELKAFGDLEILRQAKVIGMTTTGAARYQKVLARIGCPIIIVEEAAEVLEAHVVTTLHESCQHLILIGDHQQLRPSPTVYELCRHYQLDLSLFERLVNNKLPHSTLAVQHRMRPEVARLVRHIYPHLEDHVTTLDRPHIRGMKEDVFLFHHEALETTHDETISKSNVHEAALCVGLCRYLLQQGYPPQSITILAAYIGQVLEIKKLTQRSSLDGLKDVLVTAVDNYQGEENDVIILSLVRSNEEGSVGFLGTDNRVCVALSRARNGLYAFGNFRILGEKSELWRSVVKTATEHGQMGEGLTLRCENHPDTELLVTTADDFAGAPEGGCKLNCDARLECGHVCTLFCHGYDQDHVMYRCMKACERQVCDAELHSCPRRCYEDCERCMVRVEKTVPKCGHTEMVPCSTDPGRWACRILVERQWPCGHLVSAACHHTPDTFPCPEPCGAPLDCGHGCPGTCGRCFYSRVHAPCQVPCGKALEGCGHLCPLPCSTTCLPCRKVCRFSCSHSACTQSCGEPCQPCVDEPCPWECPHRPCRSKCSKPCEPCPMTCRRKLECGHRCSGCCGEECVCYSCEESKFVPLTTTGQLTKDHQGLTSHETTQLIKLPGCGHIFLAITLDVYVVRKLKSLTAARPLTCPACPKVIEDSACWRYHEKLHSRHREQQDAKRRLRDAITVSGQDKIQRSVCKLSESKGFDLEAINGYTRSLLDVNTAVTITNQIKFVRVIELILQTLRKTFSERIDFDNDLTQLVTTITSLRRDIMADKMMTDQRRREFAAELRRLTFIALLQVAKEMSSAPNPPSPIQEQADSLLEILTGRHQQDDVASRVKELCDVCKTRLDRWASVVNDSVFSILAAPPDMDLIDVESPPLSIQRVYGRRLF